ncbi:hypothetical protein M8494_27640 [Serratia ureilytica]
MQKHGDRYVWINPPTIATPEMDSVFALPYQRVPHRPTARIRDSGL